jgi:hypothetical protein
MCVVSRNTSISSSHHKMACDSENSFHFQHHGLRVLVLKSSQGSLTGTCSWSFPWQVSPSRHFESRNSGFPMLRHTEEPRDHSEDFGPFESMPRQLIWTTDLVQPVKWWCFWNVPVPSCNCPMIFARAFTNGLNVATCKNVMSYGFHCCQDAREMRIRSNHSCVRDFDRSPLLLSGR